MRDLFVGCKAFMNKVKRVDISDFLFVDVTNAEFVLIDIIVDKTLLCDRDYVWVSEIVSEVPVTAQAVSKSLKVLESKGYIERFVNEKDRRMIGVRLLDAGKEIYSKTQREFEDFIGMLEKEFSTDERNEFVRLSKKLEKVFGDVIELKQKQKQMEDNN